MSYQINYDSMERMLCWLHKRSSKCNSVVLCDSCCKVSFMIGVDIMYTNLNDNVNAVFCRNLDLIEKCFTYGPLKDMVIFQNIKLECKLCTFVCNVIIYIAKFSNILSEKKCANILIHKRFEVNSAYKGT